MAKSKKCVLSVEVYKYPYCGRLNKNEDYLSEKICCYTIRTRKKIIKKANRKALKRFLVAMGFFGIILVSSQKPARAVLPGAEGFTPKPQQISPYGRPRKLSSCNKTRVLQRIN